MQIGTLPRFLIGDRRAIEQVASDRRALNISAFFVLSAALAREYDARDLLHEPYWLAVPFAASAAVAMLLYLPLRYIIARGSPNAPSFWSGYRTILALFWMTAPLAWLYAIPYERFLAPAAAVEANLKTLGLIAAWRVILLTRACAVVTGVGFLPLFGLVLMLANGVLLAALWAMPTPIIDLMGGIRMSEPDRVLMQTTFFATAVAASAAPVLLLFAIGVLTIVRAEWRTFPQSNAGGGLLVLSVAAVAVWVGLLPLTQPEQRLAGRVERLFNRGDIDAALRTIASHDRDDFPPLWELPPRLGFPNAGPALVEVVQRVHELQIIGWVREGYVRKFEYVYLSTGLYDGMAEAQDWQQVEFLLEQLPEGPKLIETNADAIAWTRQYAAVSATSPATNASQ